MGSPQTAECRRAGPESSKSCLKTVVASEDARGGTLVFGIDGKTHKVIGIPDSQVFDDMDAISNAIMDFIEPESSRTFQRRLLRESPSS